MGLRVQTHRDHSRTWIAFDEEFSPLQWAHLPRNQIIWENIHPAWVLCPTCGWVDISSGEKIRLDARYQYSKILAKRLVYQSTSEEVLKKGELCKNISGWTTVGKGRT